MYGAWNLENISRCRLRNLRLKMTPYSDRKPAIRSELLRRARKRQLITYGQLGDAVGIPSRGPWKPVLDEIGLEETAEGRPDITYLVVNARTRLPSQIGFRAAKPPTAAQRKEAADVTRTIFDYYAG
jgi:hypothetical protein